MAFGRVLFDLPGQLPGERTAGICGGCAERGRRHIHRPALGAAQFLQRVHPAGVQRVFPRGGLRRRAGHLHGGGDPGRDGVFHPDSDRKPGGVGGLRWVHGPKPGLHQNHGEQVVSARAADADTRNYPGRIRGMDGRHDRGLYGDPTGKFCVSGPALRDMYPVHGQPGPAV